MTGVRTTRLLIPATAALAAFLSGPPVRLPAGPASAEAGCLAPADVEIDGAGNVGPFAGNEGGDLLYTRDLTGDAAQLVLRPAVGISTVLAAEGEVNDFTIGNSRERWAAFHAGSINNRGDRAVVASTRLIDDAQTPEDESIARRGVYLFRGNSTFELGRAGGASPVPDITAGFVPWGTFFDTAVLGRVDVEPVVVHFSAQLGGSDGRAGLFRWTENTGTVTPVVLAGEASPSGGAFTSFGRIRGNEAGDLVIFATTQIGQDAGTATGGLFVFDRNGGRARLLRSGLEGDDLAGGTLRSLGEFDIGGDGTVVFVGVIDGGNVGSALFRAAPPLYTIERVVAQGDATPVGGTFGGFGPAAVRIGEGGEIALCAPVSADIGGTGLFTLPPGGTIQPLGTAKDFILGAALGPGRIAYQTDDATHVVAAADGTEEGPADFRVALTDLRNVSALKGDTLTVDLRFRLPGWNDAAPASFRSGVLRYSSSAELSGAQIARIQDVRLAISQSPGQAFAFSINGTDVDPQAAATVNGNGLTMKKFASSADGLEASWTFTGTIGSGTFTCDLRDGTASLKLKQGNLLPSFEPNAFKVALTLRSAADVGANRTGTDAYFHREVRVSADQPPFGSGRRVLTKGERVPGGTCFLDTLRVDRKLKVVKGVAAPQVSSDGVSLAGTLRLCTGATAPATPTLGADVVIGDLDLSGLTTTRVGKKGSKYRYQSPRGASPAVRLELDVTGAKFTLKATGAAPLPQLTDADFAAASTAPNADDHDVGGMLLPVRLFFGRVYESDQDIAMTRLRGGKVFVR